MCGIAGFLEVGGLQHDWESHVDRMTAAIANRGPDSMGVWGDRDAGIALGHRRLSIVELSPLGHQPMVSRSGRYHLIYNGEVYNFLQLRQELETHEVHFRGASDTEVLLAAFEQWGIANAVERVVGMFAFAVWDADTRRLCLGRDRFGEKPLYCGWMGNKFLFASELKAMQQHPAWSGCVDRNALALYMRHGYIPGPYTIYQRVHKVAPGELWWIESGSQDRIQTTAYWSVEQSVTNALATQFDGTYQDAIDALDAQLRDTLRGQMISDVPLGAFLSGGVDSSAIVALMQQESTHPVKTFTIGFWEQEYDEAQDAARVAKHLGTEHTSLQVTPDDALQIIPTLAHIYDEPFADSSQIPTILVSKLARSHVTVALSGDGGDELFGGYQRYRWVQTIWDRLGWAPQSARRLAAKGVRSVSPDRWEAILAYPKGLLPSKLRYSMVGDKLHKLAGVLDASSPRALYCQLTSSWAEPQHLVLHAEEPPTALTSASIPRGIGNVTAEMMYLDTISYLVDDILVKVDRAAMSVSLETRVPFLDHRIFELAWRFPHTYKVQGSEGKRILRDLLARYVPRPLFERPKKGFSVPVAHWLRGALRPWAEELLDERRLEAQGYLNVLEVRQAWKEHCAGQRNWQARLWNVLMFQAWLDSHGHTL